MVDVLVPAQRPIVRADSILASRPVRGVEPFADAASLMHYVAASGQVLIPASMSTETALSASTAYVYAWRVLPRYQTYRRVWVISATRTTGTSGSLTIQSSDDASSTTYGMASGFPTGRIEPPIVHVSDLSSQSSTEATVNLTLTTGGGAVRINSIAMYEMPRPTLDTAVSSDNATDPTAFFPSQPIQYDKASTLITTLGDATPSLGKRTLIGWSVPVTENGTTTTSFAKSTTSTSYVSLFDADVPALGRKLGRSATTAEVSAKAFVWAAAGTTTASCRLTSTSGNTSNEVTRTSAAPGFTDVMTLTIDCTDMTAADGLQSSTFDGVNMEIKTSDGASAVYVAALCVWEP